LIVLLSFTLSNPLFYFFIFLFPSYKMDIPESSSSQPAAPRIRNLHPSQLTPTDHYGTIGHEQDHIPIERTTSTFSERLGSFVGSYSRTSMMFMAENLAVPTSVSCCSRQKASIGSLPLTFLSSSTTMKKKTNIQPFRLVMFHGFHQKILCHV
jgi:hypothetical protein